MLLFVPMAFVFVKSRQSVTIDLSYHQAYHNVFKLSNYSDGICTYHRQLLRSIAYAAIATALAFLISYPRRRDRVPRRTL